jgi:hypothetical protein
MSDAYFHTPNVNVPLNARPKGEIANVAIDQLKIWQEAAVGWPLREVTRDTRHGMICTHCQQMIYFISDGKGHLYDYTYEEIIALIVAHIRQKHERIVTHGDTRTI